MNLKNGDRVADVGAGTGYFARRIAKAVAPGGSVTAYDTEKNMVQYMRADAEKLGYANYHAEVVSAKNPVYPENRYDLVFMCNTYHHVDDRARLLGALKKALKKNGRFILLEQKMEAKYGPPKHLRIEKNRAIAEFAEAGFAPVRDEDFLPDQYFLEFRVK
jgi:ubiquinone/menaquinone biosynthesis C-methylase UbiE